MNKNLKKVISSAVAFALSLGSLSAFAANYTDLTETSNYYNAVNELSALDIINGYEDGTFRPDEKVTRAEVTKMIVAALGQVASAEAAKGATAYSDVEASHWASGFINIGSNTSGFINGMGDGTFKPEGNVTYAQLVKMLVSALGYGGMALQEGGYPTGYIAVGDRIGVTKSVVANANDELTRGQVAVLIDNSINLPLLVNTTWSAANPEYQIKDDYGSEFQSMLTQYHDTYKVEGKIIETSKSGNVETGEAKFQIAVADRFDDDEWYTRTDSTADRDVTVKVLNGIDATGELFAYSTALIHKNDDDEYELISLNTSAKSKVVTLSAGAFDEENSTYSDYTGATDEEKAADAISNYKPLKYYATDAKTGKVTEYKLADGENGRNEAEIWVNGVSVGYVGDSKAEIEAYLTDNEVGTVTLVDAPQEGKATTDGYYDYILVSYYKSAIVDSVQTSNGTVYFDVSEQGLPSNVKLDPTDVDNDELEYTITLDGKEIDVKDLQEDDVLAIAFDVTAAGNIKTAFEDSKFYDIIVTRGTVEGKITSDNTDDQKYTINGTEYKYDDYLLPDSVSDDAVGMEATLYVDAFGRIVKLEETSSSKKYAIVENVYYKEGEDVYFAKLILPDGSIIDREIKNDTELTKLLKLAYGVSNYDDKDEKVAIYDRVCTYKVNSSNQVYSIETVAGSKQSGGVTDDYSAKNNKIGKIKLNDTSKIIDASDYMETGKVADLTSVTKLIDDTEYTAYGFDKLTTDSSYSFVIITEGIGGYSDDTQIAVYEKTSYELDKEGDSKEAITVLFEGKEQVFILDDLDDAGNITDVDSLNKGDVIVFQRNSSDEVTQINRLAAMPLSDGTSRIAYDSEDLGAVAARAINKWKTDDTGATYKSDSDVEVHYGVITDRVSGEITLTPYGEDDAAAEDYTITDDTIIYVYDYDKSNSAALFVGSKADLVKTSIGKSFKNDDDIDWDAIQDDDTMRNSLNFVFVRTDKDDIKEAFIVLSTGKA